MKATLPSRYSADVSIATQARGKLAVLHGAGYRRGAGKGGKQDQESTALQRSGQEEFNR